MSTKKLFLEVAQEALVFNRVLILQATSESEKNIYCRRQNKYCVITVINFFHGTFEPPYLTL
jgi:hypothetical protein